MIEAELKGKIPEIDGWEDILTSSVFGILKYRPLWPILARFVGAARCYSDADATFGDVLKIISQEGCHIHFWHHTTEYGEPDIILETADAAVVIEVKFMAGLSGQDQLAKYLRLLDSQFADKSQRHVVYLTRNLSRPDLGEAVVNELDGRLWWLSWYDLADCLRSGEVVDPFRTQLVEDLTRLLDHRRLRLFQCFTDPSNQSTAVLNYFWDGTVPLMGIYPSSVPSTHLFWKEEFL